MLLSPKHRQQVWVVRLSGLCLCLSLIVSGCLNLGQGTRQTTRFYMLHSLADDIDPAQRDAVDTPVSIGIGPLTLPDYLDRPHLVVRLHRNEYHRAPFARWAEPLDVNFKRVLAENLKVLLPESQPVVHPWRPGQTPALRIEVAVLRFDVTPGGDALLNVRWVLRRQGHDKSLLVRHITLAAPVADKQYDAMVAALSRTIVDLSREMASLVRKQF